MTATLPAGADTLRPARTPEGPPRTLLRSAGGPRGRKGWLLVRDESRGGPGQGLLAEERRAGDAVVDKEDQPHERRPGRDHERAAYLPVDAGHRPHRVVVQGLDVVVKPDAPAAEEPQDHRADPGQDSLH